MPVKKAHDVPAERRTVKGSERRFSLTCEGNGAGKGEL